MSESLSSKSEARNPKEIRMKAKARKYQKWKMTRVPEEF
jgi:hypothetical protein